MVSRSMNISFVGQTSVLGQTARDRRVRALAQELGSKGHIVTAFSATETSTRHLPGLTLGHAPSFSPETPGGWLYTIISLLRAALAFPEVLHVMSWKAAALAPLAAMIHPEATIIWTIDSAPQKLSRMYRLVVWVGARVCDAIVTPTRSLQYQIRLQCGILPAYVPDGYSPKTLRDIPSSYWKLRKNQYVLVIAETIDTISRLCTTYAKAGNRKKLVFLVKESTPRLQRLGKKYRFVHAITSATPRQRHSLMRQAACVVFLEEAGGQELLVAMDAGKPIVSANTPLSQEIAATTAAFFKLGDMGHAVDLVLGRDMATAAKKARIRARSHFSWTRIFEEYEPLYHYPLVRRIPLDSIQPSRILQTAVY